MKSGRKNYLVWAKKYHKWPALIISFFLLMFAFSGIVLNHRSLFSEVEIDRKLLPRRYRYENWNNSAIAGAVIQENGEILIYGNIGVWKTDSTFSKFTDFNEGFPQGIDNRKVRCIVSDDSGDLYAGTFFGLFHRVRENNSWVKIELPKDKQRIQDLVITDSTLYVLTRSNLLRLPLFNSSMIIEEVQLQHPEDFSDKISLFKLLWMLHSGKLFGKVGKLVVDLMGLILIFLVITGLTYFFIPKIIRRRKKKNLSINKLKQARTTDLRWHNKTGAWLILFLIVVAITGIFLRPPLLLFIANSKIPSVKFSLLDNSNPWYDNLRAVIYDHRKKQFIFSTSDGFYYTSKLFAEPLHQFPAEPPVSVMGINVFKQYGPDSYLVGSFNGIYHWDVDKEIITDYITGDLVSSDKSKGRPIDEHMIAGIIQNGSGEILLDYDDGAFAVQGISLPPMSPEMIEKSPISLWNLALEIHTGRIYQAFLGPFYILIVPLIGLSTILVLITGWLRWRNIFKK